MRRVAIIGSASGNGKTTLGRILAERLARRTGRWIADV
jgi:ABC-type glutathione transport system ATPase component